MALTAISAAVLYAIFIWWFSTGAILWLDRRPRATYRASLTAATLVASAAVYGLVRTLGDDTPTGAVLAFTCALALWGWHELAFLTGLISGPRTSPCPPDATGWRRFKLAASTLMFHEIALALTAAAILALTWGAPNPIGGWTFAILLVSRLSAKLNLFFGVAELLRGVLPRTPRLSDQLPAQERRQRPLPGVHRRAARPWPARKRGRPFIRARGPSRRWAGRSCSRSRSSP